VTIPFPTDSDRELYQLRAENEALYEQREKLEQRIAAQEAKLRRCARLFDELWDELSNYR
jgi:hypothetical protein